MEKRKQRKHMGLKIFLLIILAVILIMVGVIIADSNRFVIREYTIESDKVEKDHTFLYISDLHDKTYGKNNERLLKALEGIEAEFCLLGGDMVTAHKGEDYTPAVELITYLNGRMPVVYSEGNHEQKLSLKPDYYGNVFEKYTEELDKIGVSVLYNEKVSIEDIDVFCFSLDRAFYRYDGISFRRDYMDTLLGDSDPDRFSILLAHNPHYSECYTTWPHDLTLSGHYHGGMFRIPGIGGIVSPRFDLFPDYDGGEFDVNGQKIIVGRGLGAHTLPFRLFNPGEILVIHVKKR